MFAEHHRADGRLSLWVPVADGLQPIMIEESPDTYFRPPYVGVNGWVGILLDQIADDALESHLREARRIIASKRKPARKPRGTKEPTWRRRAAAPSPPAPPHPRTPHPRTLAPHRRVTRHAPRPCVNANNCFCPAGVRISESHIVTAGPNPVSSVIHVLAAVDRHHHTEIGAEVEPLPIVRIDDDRVDRDVGKARRAGAIEALPRLAVVDAAKDMRAAEVAVGGVEHVVVERIECDRCHPSAAWSGEGCGRRPRRRSSVTRAM